MFHFLTVSQLFVAFSYQNYKFFIFNTIEKMCAILNGVECAVLNDARRNATRLG